MIQNKAFIVGVRPHMAVRVGEGSKQDVVSVSGVKFEVAIDQLTCQPERKLAVDKSKDKLEPTRRKWDPHLSLTTSNLDALDDLQEISACFTTKLHTQLAKDLQKQQTW